MHISLPFVLEGFLFCCERQISLLDQIMLGSPLLWALPCLGARKNVKCGCSLGDREARQNVVCIGRATTGARQQVAGAKSVMQSSHTLDALQKWRPRATLLSALRVAGVWFMRLGCACSGVPAVRPSHFSFPREFSLLLQAVDLSVASN